MRPLTAFAALAIGLLLGGSLLLATRTAPLALDGSDIVGTIDVDPAEPKVGDAVVVTATASGWGFIAAHYPFVTPEGQSALITVDSAPSQEWPPLGYPASPDLAAVRPGDATLRVAAHYDKPVCYGDPPRCSTNFLRVDSDGAGIHVAPGPGRTPTPTRTRDWDTSLGDVDCNGTISSVDALMILQHHGGLIASLPCESKGDVDGDGAIGPADATLILRFSAGLLHALPPSPRQPSPPPADTLTPTATPSTTPDRAPTSTPDPLLRSPSAYWVFAHLFDIYRVLYPEIVCEMSGSRDLTCETSRWSMTCGDVSSPWGDIWLCSHSEDGQFTCGDNTGTCNGAGWEGGCTAEQLPEGGWDVDCWRTDDLGTERLSCAMDGFRRYDCTWEGVMSFSCALEAGLWTCEPS